jgi:hypothetical protein
MIRTVLALVLGLSSSGLAPAAGAQDQQEVLPCRVCQGQTTVATGRMILSTCLRTIYARAVTGTWGRHEIEIAQDGRVRIDSEDFGLLRAHGGSIEDVQRR